MKKIVSLLLILVAFSSCESDVKFSNPGLQGRKDNLIWRAGLTDAIFEATDATVDPNIGNLTILGYRGLEIVAVKIPFDLTEPVSQAAPMTYRYGYDPAHPEVDDDMVAAYTFQDSGVTLEYYTGTGYNDEKADKGNAEVTITSYDVLTKKITGNFKFNAKYQGESSDLIPENVNFQEGAFFSVQVH